MLDRRQSTREKVIYGGVASFGEQGTTRDCIVRNISETGASLEFRNILNLPSERMSLTIAKKGRCFPSRVIWRREHLVGVAFRSEATAPLPDSDLLKQLQSSEKKQRQLQRQIKQLLGEI